MTARTTHRLARLLLRLLLAVAAALGAVLLAPATASAASAAPMTAQSGVVAMDADCKESPTPDMPGQGLAGFFTRAPDPLPPAEDPFAPGATTTVFEQYGYAGLRWNTYDLGCGPDVARNPDAVVGTSIGNWITNIPVLFASLTGAVTDTAFAPGFMGAFDPLIGVVSSTLYLVLFSQWAPVTITLLGFWVVFKARRAHLSTTATALGQAAIVLVLAATLFRWPVTAGHLTDDTTTAVLGGVVTSLHTDQPGRDRQPTPGTAVSSSVHESVFYRNWLIGELGSADSPTAREYGPDLFKAQALTWREAALLQTDPAAGRELIEDKRDEFGDIADQIRETDPVAYEHLTGKRSDTRVGYAFITTLVVLLILPFLLMAALLLIGSFIIVRLAVMLFPALAVLGIYPAARGVVTGIGTVVGAAVINAMVFGVGAAITVRIVEELLNPTIGLPQWLVLVLLPVFTFMMWAALKPFRRLTQMVSPGTNPFADATGSLGAAGRRTGRMVGRLAATAAGSFAGNAAASAVMDDDEDTPAAKPEQPTQRYEARPAPPIAAPTGTGTAPAALPPGSGTPPQPDAAPRPESAATADSGSATDLPRHQPGAPEATAPPAPVEPEWDDGEQVYTIYRPDEPGGTDAA